MSSKQFLLYGANGFTGQLICEKAASYDLEPILAGRKEEQIIPLAKKFKNAYRIFDLSNQEKLKEALGEVNVVLHAAGPFKYTAKSMIEACIQTNTHYLDITGEIPVFEMAKSFDESAKKAGLMILPGVGFDVVPTDCLSLFLKAQLPDASELKLAFAAPGGAISHGTAMTMIENLGEGGMVRKNGKLVKEPLGDKGMWVDFGEKKLFVITIPWGDISTAYHSTGIPNIETYAAISPGIYRLLKLQRLFNWILKMGTVRSYLKKKINNKPAGPSEKSRASGKSLIWGEVQNIHGNKIQGRLTGPDGYTLTAHSSLLITKKVLDGHFKLGYQTPSSAYGADLILEVPATTRELISIN